MNDYSSNYTDRSLVDKEYVDNKKPYKDFSFFFTQTGTSNPDITILENDLGETPVYTRVSDGIFSFSGSSVFTLNKTILLPSYNPADNFYFNKNSHVNTNEFIIECRDMLGNLKDEIDNKFLQIRIYN